eukprot:m.133670 g.133670  ORF g.133670 m.133670 type:complete len:92 (+) comp13946_c1_seq1:3162-3437(+)
MMTSCRHGVGCCFGDELKSQHTKPPTHTRGPGRWGATQNSLRHKVEALHKKRKRNVAAISVDARAESVGKETRLKKKGLRMNGRFGTRFGT